MKHLIIYKSLLLQSIIYDQYGEHYPYELFKYIATMLCQSSYVKLFSGTDYTCVKFLHILYKLGRVGQIEISSILNINKFSLTQYLILTDSGDVYNYDRTLTQRRVIDYTGVHNISVHPKLLLPPIKKMIGNHRHTLFLSNNGKLYVHHGKINIIYTSLDIFLTNVKDIACGLDHVLILTNDGILYGFGDDSFLQLGLNYRRTACNNDRRLYELFYDKSLNVKAVFAGGNSSFIITHNDELYGWGSNGYNQLGFLISYANEGRLTKINIANVKSVACGLQHTLILTRCGDLYSCGSNGYGQLGTASATEKLEETTMLIPLLPTIEEKRLPVKVNLPPIVKISCGHNHSIAVSMNTRVYGWGLNNDDQLGLGDKLNRPYPVEIKL